GDDGTATITYPDGTKDTIPGEDLVIQKSASPTVNTPTEGDKTVTGTGVPGSEITVTDPEGNVIGTATVDSEGNWSVDVPADKPLTEGDTLTVSQTEEGKSPSKITTTVEAADQPSEPTDPEEP
ncbi:MAG: Ig-like domain-containing protein, partial [Anaerococcus sp.]|nr:Ig-like domain-containing protein [Anaerococcus sp.]